MVIDQINVGGITFLEAEDDAPVAAHRNAPISREVSFQRVKAKPRHVMFLGPGGHVQPRKDAGKFVRMLRVHLAPVVVFVQAFQPAMPKMPDHRAFVK
jgi:hypothetical protein